MTRIFVRFFGYNLLLSSDFNLTVFLRFFKTVERKKYITRKVSTVYSVQVAMNLKILMSFQLFIQRLPSIHTVRYLLSWVVVLYFCAIFIAFISSAISEDSTLCAISTWKQRYANCKKNRSNDARKLLRHPSTSFTTVLRVKSKVLFVWVGTVCAI